MSKSEMRPSKTSADATGKTTAEHESQQGTKTTTTTSQQVVLPAGGGKRGSSRELHVDVQVNTFSNAIRKQALFWIGATIVFALFLSAFSSILLPFVAGMALAYFLDPVANRLERFGMSRLVATIVILIGFVLVLVLALILIVPVLVTQLAEFVSKFPDYFTQLQGLVTAQNTEWLKKYLGLNSKLVQDNLAGVVRQGASFLSGLLQSLWNSGKSLIDIAGLFVVTPVVAFYMLLDWGRMVQTIDNCIPRDHLATVRQLAREMNAAIGGFIRGQGTLCLILGSYYAVGLSIVGLNFGLLIGFFAGVISFIPYVGSIVGLVLAISVALVQFWPDWGMVVAVAMVFFTGQFIEGNILQPKLVGSSVGLHPVWLMFALFAFGAMLGFTGMLIAVPAAAAVAVLVRFAVKQYLQSPLYKSSQSDQ